MRVAAGLGLEAPKRSVDLADVTPSPVLSRVGGQWPVTGRVVGLVVGPEPDLAEVAAARQATLAAGMVPLVVAPTGGVLGNGTDAVDVQRTYANARSVEFDAVLLVEPTPPAPDALPALDAKAGAGTAPALDPRIALLLDETYRHAKAIVAVGNGYDTLTAFGATGAPGIVDAPDAAAGVQEIADLLTTHRVWERGAR